MKIALPSVLPPDLRRARDGAIRQLHGLSRHGVKTNGPSVVVRQRLASVAEINAADKTSLRNALKRSCAMRFCRLTAARLKR